MATYGFGEVNCASYTLEWFMDNSVVDPSLFTMDNVNKKLWYLYNTDVALIG